jgi:hypothetical protein
MTVRTGIAGREGYFKEADDDDSQVDTGASKGIAVSFEFGEKTFRPEHSGPATIRWA